MISQDSLPTAILRRIESAQVPSMEALHFQNLYSLYRFFNYRESGRATQKFPSFGGIFNSPFVFPQGSQHESSALPGLAGMLHRIVL